MPGKKAQRREERLQRALAREAQERAAREAQGRAARAEYLRAMEAERAQDLRLVELPPDDHSEVVEHARRAQEREPEILLLDRERVLRRSPLRSLLFFATLGIGPLR